MKDVLDDAAVAAIIAPIEAGARARHPEADVSMDALTACHDTILAAYRARVRVEVMNLRTGHVRRGVVGITTGWRPVFLLIARATSLGSTDVLGPDDVVTSYRNGRDYTPVAKVVASE